jgi:hypothetical protein
MTNSDIFGGLKICTTLDFHFCYFLHSLVYKIFWVEILQVCRIHRCLYLGFFQFFLTVKCCFQFLERNPICGTSCICSFLIGVRHFVACSPFFPPLEQKCFLIPQHCSWVYNCSCLQGSTETKQKKAPAGCNYYGLSILYGLPGPNL